MKKLALALVATLVVTCTTALPAYASVLATQTVPAAAAASLYDTYHDAPTGFVFVKLADGWRFVAADKDATTHPVFHDASTGFLFVKLSSGWKFVRAT